MPKYGCNTVPHTKLDIFLKKNVDLDALIRWWIAANFDLMHPFPSEIQSNPLWMRTKLCACVFVEAIGSRHKQKALRSRWTPLIWPPMMQSILSSVNCSNCTIGIKFRSIGTVHLWCHYSCARAMTTEANAFHDAKCINISMVVFCNLPFYRFRFLATVLKVAFVRLSQQCGLKNHS